MQSTTIENILHSRKDFLGCFPFDKLPPFPTTFPKTVILNTHRSNKPGEHWIGLVLSKKHCFYFDSFGLPIINKTIVEYLNSYYKFVKYSSICIQHIESNKCGEFCIAFVTQVENKRTYEKFISQFNLLNVKENNVIIEKVIGHYVI